VLAVLERSKAVRFVEGDGIDRGIHAQFGHPSVSSQFFEPSEQGATDPLAAICRIYVDGAQL